jgi:hypothetical protein
MTIFSQQDNESGDFGNEMKKLKRKENPCKYLDMRIMKIGFFCGEFSFVVFHCICDCLH